MKNLLPLFIMAGTILLFVFIVRGNPSIKESSNTILQKNETTEAANYQPNAQSKSRLISVVLIAACIGAWSFVSSKKEKTAPETVKLDSEKETLETAAKSGSNYYTPKYRDMNIPRIIVPKYIKQPIVKS